MSSTSTLSVIVPVRDSGAQHLETLLSSLQRSESNDFEVIVNDDPRTVDNSAEVVNRFGQAGMRISYLIENRSRAFGRKRGADVASGRILLHLDSDMQVTPQLVGECIAMIDQGFDAMVIPEESFGANYWAHVRALEKRCYDGVDSIEALRCITAEVYDKVGGHNVEMVFAEDKDLDNRVRANGARVGRTQSLLLHDEGSPTLRGIARKKMGYFGTARLYQAEHPEAFREQVSVIARITILLKSIRLGARHPFLYAGIFVIGLVEYAGVLIVRIKERFVPHRVARAT